MDGGWTTENRVQNSVAFDSYGGGQPDFVGEIGGKNPDFENAGEFWLFSGAVSNAGGIPK